jgi:hypothetical protein
MPAGLLLKPRTKGEGVSWSDILFRAAEGVYDWVRRVDEGGGCIWAVREAGKSYGRITSVTEGTQRVRGMEAGHSLPTNLK